MIQPYERLWDFQSYFTISSSNHATLQETKAKTMFSTLYRWHLWPLFLFFFDLDVSKSKHYIFHSQIMKETIYSNLIDHWKHVYLSKYWCRNIWLSFSFLMIWKHQVNLSFHERSGNCFKPLKVILKVIVFQNVQNYAYWTSF